MTNTVPIRNWSDIIEEEYLAGFIRDGGAAIKFAIPAGDGLFPLLETRLTWVASSLGYLVAGVDSGLTRVHMPQEIFFSVAEQVDWRLLARKVILRLCQEEGYDVDTIDPSRETPVLEAVSAANSVEENMIALEMRRSLFRSIAQNTNMSRDFRMAMTHFCRAEMTSAGQEDEAGPLIEWVTGANRRVANVRHYSIYNSIVRTNARHLFESLLYWVRFAGYAGTVVLLNNSRVTLLRNPRDGLLFYSRPAAMDHYELLRELIDGTDRMIGFLGIVLSNEEFLSDDRKGIPIYQALLARIADEVRPRTQANPLATLVRLSDGQIAE